MSSNTVLCFGVKYSIKLLIFLSEFLCDIWDDLYHLIKSARQLNRREEALSKIMMKYVEVWTELYPEFKSI